MFALSNTSGPGSAAWAMRCTAIPRPTASAPTPRSRTPTTSPEARPCPEGQGRSSLLQATTPSGRRSRADRRARQQVDRGIRPDLREPRPPVDLDRPRADASATWRPARRRRPRRREQRARRCARRSPSSPTSSTATACEMNQRALARRGERTAPLNPPRRATASSYYQATDLARRPSAASLAGAGRQADLATLDVVGQAASPCSPASAVKPGSSGARHRPAARPRHRRLCHRARPRPDRPAGDWADMRETKETGCVLVRPDQHVAFRVPEVTANARGGTGGRAAADPSGALRPCSAPPPNARALLHRGVLATQASVTSAGRYSSPPAPAGAAG